MSKKDKTKKQDLTSDLKKLYQICEWFEEQEEVDIEEGLKKVKEAAGLIKRSKERLKEIENEFEEIKEEITEEIEKEGELEEEEESEEEFEEYEDNNGEMGVEDIPF